MRVSGSVPGAASYAVYAAQGTAAFFPAQSGLGETSVVVAGLAPTRSYRFFVRALDAAGNELAQSNTVSITDLLIDKEFRADVG